MQILYPPPRLRGLSPIKPPTHYASYAFHLPRKSKVGAGNDVSPEVTTFQLQKSNNQDGLDNLATLDIVNKTS